MGYVKNRNSCQLATQHLVDGMHWEKTPEGYEFWLRIYSRLRVLGKGEEPTTSLKEEEVTSNRIALLEGQVAERDRTINSQAQTIATLQSKLRVADWVNMGR